MREWSLRAGDPLSLTLCSDARLATPDYLNDHIWELSLGGGEPPSLCLRTTYGLRARSMRVFYRFTEAGRTLTDPAQFHEPPHLRRFHPSFLSLDFVPVEGLHTTAEYWVPDSHVIAGRVVLTNTTSFPRHVEFELCAVLNPLEGKAFGFARQQQLVRILSGNTGGLNPVVFLTGGPRPGTGAHPSLRLSMDFDSGSSRTFAWACAAEAAESASFELARRTAGRNWEAERARIELTDTRHVVEIHTGDPDWDAALALSQSAALGLFIPGGQLPHASFVRVRGPDHGHSARGDGSDYPPSWSGQTAFDALYMHALLPGASDLRRGLLQNFLGVQMEDGTIDARPGVAGQRSRFQAPPLLASMAWQHYLQTHDDQYLMQVLPRLLAFFNAWFDPARDRDGDAIPEWEHVLQTGFDENPLFDVWYPWSQSLHIQGLLNPELEALLLHEASVLSRMVAEIGPQEELSAIQQRGQALTASLRTSWNQRQGRYVYRDRLTGSSWTDRLIGSRKGPGEIRPRRPECEQPVRLLMQVHTKAAAATRPIVEIFGRSRVPPRTNGRKNAAPVESLSPDDPPQTEQIAAAHFQWRSGGLVAISSLVYGKVDRILVDGLAANDRLIVRTLNTEGDDITLFAPLWAQVPSAGQARQMADRLFQPESGFDRPFGIPMMPASPSTARRGSREQNEAGALALGVQLPWNNLVIDGLLAYGLREEAARLLTRVMAAVIHCLKQNQAFYERYHAVTGSGLGERNALTGLAPTGLFLNVLGVQILSPTSVRLEGTNPFPWPVAINFHGTRIVRGAESTEITFPNAAPIVITDVAPSLVTA